jgi:hypothetical protein
MTLLYSFQINLTLGYKFTEISTLQTYAGILPNNHLNINSRNWYFSLLGLRMHTSSSFNCLFCCSFNRNVLTSLLTLFVNCL